MNGCPSDRRGRETGSVLVLSLLVTMVILGVGITAMWLASSSTRVSSNMARRQEALYAAESGIERGRTIVGTNTTSAKLNELISGSPGAPCDAKGRDDPRRKVTVKPKAGRYEHPWVGKGNVLCDGKDPLTDIRVIEATSKSAGMFAKSAKGVKAYQFDKIAYTVYIRDDEVDEEANGPLNDTDRRVVLRAEGVGRDGVTVVTLEAVVTANPQGPGRNCYAQAGGCGGQGANSDKNANIKSAP